MKIVKNENETVIYPMLAENDTPNDGDFCIVLSNTFTMINHTIVDDDDLPSIIGGLEKALDLLGVPGLGIDKMNKRAKIST